MDRRRIILIGGVAVVVIAILIVALLSRGMNQVATINSNTGLINYANSITGQTVEDKPNENTPPVTGILNAPAATILGYESTNGYLSPNQSHSLLLTLSQFLMAHTGLTNVTAGIKNTAITQQSDGSLTFTLVAMRPQASYTVTVKLDSGYDLVQSVTFKRVN